MKIRSLLSTAAAAALLVGCASVGNNFDSRKVAEIKKGETTEADLVSMFGKPDQRTLSSESGPKLIWIYSEARVKGETFIPFAGAFVGGARTKTKTLTVELAHDGKVKNYEYTGGGFESTGTTKPDPEEKK